MKTNAEIRAEAWGIVRSPQVWQVVWSGVLLTLVAAGMVVGVTFAYHMLEIQTWDDFNALNRAHGFQMTVPSRALWWRMTGATAFQSFVQYLATGLFASGCYAVLLKTVRKNSTSLFSAAISGFSRPLDVFWLSFRMSLQIMLWSLLLIVPGIIAAYRYRLAWFLKCDHPDWGAGRCLAESGRRMSGQKGRAFGLDCSYWKSLTLAVLPLIALEIVLALGAAGTIASVVFWGIVLGGLTIFGICLFSIYLALGQAIFYEELAAEPQAAEKNF